MARVKRGVTSHAKHDTIRRGPARVMGVVSHFVRLVVCAHDPGTFALKVVQPEKCLTQPNCQNPGTDPASTAQMFRDDVPEINRSLL